MCVCVPFYSLHASIGNVYKLCTLLFTSSFYIIHTWTANVDMYYFHVMSLFWLVSDNSWSQVMFSFFIVPTLNKFILILSSLTLSYRFFVIRNFANKMRITFQGYIVCNCPWQLQSSSADRYLIPILDEIYNFSVLLIITGFAMCFEWHIKYTVIRVNYQKQSVHGGLPSPPYWNSLIIWVSMATVTKATRVNNSHAGARSTFLPLAAWICQV